MLSVLEPQGRLGVTAIADTPEEAQQLYLRVVALLDRLASEAPAGRQAEPAARRGRRG